MTIRQGRASRVADLGDGTVLRLGGHPEREARIIDHVRRHGFPAPPVVEVRSDGMVLERIDGPTMGDVILSPDGPVLIDWTNAHAGNAVDDVALTWLIIETSAGLGGRVLARFFRARVGGRVIRSGLPGASAFRLADAHVTDAERARVRRAMAGVASRRLVSSSARP
jgi:hypothetical protein